MNKEQVQEFKIVQNGKGELVKIISFKEQIIEEQVTKFNKFMKSALNTIK